MNENLLELFTKAKSLLIIVAKTGKPDSVASSIALSIAAIKEGKTVSICTETSIQETKSLVGNDKILTSLTLGGNTLKVSFPYKEGSIDKVTYNITDDKFNLLVEPRKGEKPLEFKDVQYGYTGGSVDLIVTIDAPNLESLGNIYLDNPDVFVKEKIVNIDRRFDNKNYGIHNLVEKQYSSTSEIVIRLLQLLRWELNPDIATSLYFGISQATNNFTSFSTNAQTFEAISYLLRSGARKSNPHINKEVPSENVSYSEDSLVDESQIFSQPFNQAAGKTINLSPKSNGQKTNKDSFKKENPLKPDIFMNPDLI